MQKNPVCFNWLIKLLALCILTCQSWANPTLAVPNIAIPNTSAQIPGFVSLDPHNYSDDVANKMLQQKLATFSALIRGRLVQNGNFQLVDVDNNLVQYYLISESSPNTESDSFESFAAISAKRGSVPDYLLIGTLAALNAGQETTPIPNSNKSSAIYSIDLAVDFILVRTKDHRKLTAFTAAGHAGDVRLVSSASSQKISHNLPKLIQQAGNDLSSEVMTQINGLLLAGKLSTNESASLALDPYSHQDLK